MTSKIRILDSVLKPPILETDKANIIEFFGDRGELVALLTKEFNSQLWCFSSVKDEDWMETLLRNGYMRINEQELNKRLFGIS